MSRVQVVASIGDQGAAEAGQATDDAHLGGFRSDAEQFELGAVVAVYTDILGREE
jgi:hypothetical protein